MKAYYETDLGKLYHGNCLDIMPGLEEIDLILTDPPYGLTQNSWDDPVNLDLFWPYAKQIIKANGAIVLTAIQPFTSLLVTSNPEWFKYELIWIKSRPTGFLNCKYRPLRSHENILVFYNEKPIYNPQKTEGPPYTCSSDAKRPKLNWGELKGTEATHNSGSREPLSVIKISSSNDNLHPTRKPIKLFAYLTETHTNEGDLILDPFLGSGTTAIACEKLNRKWIGIEKEEKYCEMSAQRIESEAAQLKMFRQA